MISQFNPEEATRLIRQRRSIFPNMYSEEPVSNEIIREMLENANWAPTHRLTEPWRFVVFKGEGLKRYADFQAEMYRKTAEAAGNYDEAKFEKLSTKPLKASHIIAIGMHRNEKELVPEVEEICSVAAAVQNMYLSATAHGVGCYWTTGGTTFIEEAKPFFNLGEKDQLLGFLYVGNLKSDKWPQGRRKSIDEKVSWVTG